VRRSLSLLAAAVLAGCGTGADRPATRPPLATSAPSVGASARHRPPSLSQRAKLGRPIRGLRCTTRSGPRYGVHLELFAGRRVVLIPPGIGVAPPRIRRGAYVPSGRCSYALRTREPTGVIEVAPTSSPLTLGDLFAIWGKPLSPRRMAGFRGRVRAYVNGHRWRREPSAIPLSRHAQIVLEVGGHVPPHRTYRFPPGL
jgi:hypothetical protein